MSLNFAIYCRNITKMGVKIAEIIKNFAVEGDFILLKASHGIALERLVPLLNGGGTENA